MTTMTMTATLMALVMLATTSGCVPSYFVRSNELGRDEVSSVRASDGKTVTLQGGSFRVTKDPPLADGRVRVSGPGRHGRMWLIGLMITTIGVGIGLTAIGLFVKSGDGINSEGTSATPSDSHAFELSAIVLGSAGLLGGALVGPSVWIAGARQAPIELHF
ncbi:MAG TPA: hypothetical protein VIA18_16555 [Polyangia bacterium]|jgi:hypothetical protein|nr:hypothetical protein [Polyangia bacterium]HWE31184.1 hypothetical protein [Polyangia bacterium]